MKDTKHYAMSDSPQIVGSDVTKGVDGRRPHRRWRTSSRRPITSTSSMQSTSRPLMAAMRPSKRRARRKDVLFVAVDGGCQGVKMGQGRHPRRDLPAISAADGGRRRRGGRRIHQDRARSRRASTPARSSLPTIRLRAFLRSRSDEAHEDLLGLISRSVRSLIL